VDFEKKIFETHNLDLGAYLMLEGIKWVGCRIVIDARRDEPKAMLQFSDEKQNCRDLERVFINSREKRFREYNKLLLKEVHKEIRNFNSKLKDQIGD